LPLNFPSVFNSVWQHDSIANLACGHYGSSFFLLFPAKKNMSAVSDVSQQQHTVSGHSFCVSYGALEDILLS
jgi:hypothetical protein